jgi:hypothetical protein
VANQAPTISGPSSVSISTGQVVAASTLFTGASDPDGTIAKYRFSDATPGAGYLALNGVKIGSSVDVTVAQLSQLTYVAGTTAGSNAIVIEAIDNLGLDSNDLTVTVNVVAATANRAPTITGPSSVSISTGQVVAASTLFTSASDPDGTIAKYRFSDATPGAGYLALNGVKIGSSVDVTVAQLSQLTYVAGTTAGSNAIIIEAIDNLGLDSNDLAVTVNVVASTSGNRAPTISGPSSVTISTGQVVAASTLFTGASDPDGSIAKYRFSDSTPGAGYLALNGVKIGSSVDVTVAQLSQLTYVAGTTAGSNAIVIEAIDNLGLDSNDLAVTVNVIAATTANRAPTITGPSSVSISTGQVVAASTLFTSASDPDGSIAKYRFSDATAGAGYLALNGVKIGSSVDVTVAQLSQLTYVAGTTAGSNAIVIEAIDNLGLDSNDLAVTVNVVASTSINRAPTISGPSSVSISTGQVVAASTLFTGASDPDGSIAKYRFSDATPGAGYLALNGVKIGSSVDVTVAQLSQLTYVAGTTAGSNAIVIEAIDNLGLDSNDLALTINVVSAGTNKAPIISGSGTISMGINTSIGAQALYMSVSDPDGSISLITFWDSTPGTGFLTLDGNRIQGSSVSVAASQVARVGYSAGPSAGSNDLLLEVTDNNGKVGAGLSVHLVVSGPTASQGDKNSLADYQDATAGSATPEEIVNLARQFVGIPWGTYNCTGLLWAISYEAGARFFDSRNRLVDSNHVYDADTSGYIVPNYDHAEDAWGDNWELVSTGRNWVAVVEPGDFVRLSYNGAQNWHSLVVTSVTFEGQTRRVTVIDNTTSVVREYRLDGFREDGSVSATEQSFLTPNAAWVHRLTGKLAIGQDSPGITSWSPSEETHSVVGSSAIDTLAINARMDSSAAIKISGADGKVAFSDLVSGALLLDADDYEEISFTGGIGPDKIVIGSLAGTDVAQSTVFLYGGEGADSLDAAQSDRRIVFYGGTESDILLGGSGDDLLSGGIGNDTIDGGLGTDTAQFEWLSDDSLILALGQSVAVIDRRNGNIDSLKHVELLQFDDVTLIVAALPQFAALDYIATHPDLIRAFGADGQAGFDHYLNHGLFEGRNPDGFDGLQYLAGYPDLFKAYGLDETAAARHYIQYGFREGRAADPFDGAQYVAGYSDLIPLLGTGERAAAEHFLRFGSKEGRLADSFDGIQYVASYDDLIRTIGANEHEAAVHFINAGFYQGRARDAFSSLQYVASYNDLIGAIGTNDRAAAEHFINFGSREGRVRDAFDGLQYVAGSDELIRTIGGNEDAAARHFITIGFAAGLPRDGFDGLRYVAGYNDLIPLFGTNEHAAAEHFINFGFREGRLRDAFDGLQYIATYNDLVLSLGANAAAGTLHFVTTGFAQGRVRDGFSALQYVASYPDLIKSIGANEKAATEHFINFGLKEGRVRDAFNGLDYIAGYDDLIRAYGSNEDAGANHYIRFGFREGRARDGFDGLQYIAGYDDLIRAFGLNEDAAVHHFLERGFKEGRARDPFDGLQYVASYADLIGTIGTDEHRAAEHFVTVGSREGRARDLFDAGQYLANYADLRAAFGTDQHAATQHYVEYGYYEGRTDDPIFG